MLQQKTRREPGWSFWDLLICYSDPYCVLSLRKNGKKVEKQQIFKTKVVEKTLDPVWFEEFTLYELQHLVAYLLQHTAKEVQRADSESADARQGSVHHR